MPLIVQGTFIDQPTRARQFNNNGIELADLLGFNVQKVTFRTLDPAI